MKSDTVCRAHLSLSNINIFKALHNIKLEIFSSASSCNIPTTSVNKLLLFPDSECLIRNISHLILVIVWNF